jgi:PadR family transcriptional regulator PadR
MTELLGTFEQIVLLAVANLGEDAYGRAVLRTVQNSLSEGRPVAAGAVYATLDRVEAKAYLSSRLEPGTAARGGRARRYYRLTAEGVSALAETRGVLERMWQGTRALEVPA